MATPWARVGSAVGKIKKQTNVRRRSGGQPALCAMCGFDSHTASYPSGSAGIKGLARLAGGVGVLVSSGSRGGIETVKNPSWPETNDCAVGSGRAYAQVGVLWVG